MSLAAAAGLPPPPILVLAAPGTPAATLAAALGRHPGAFDLPEPNLWLADSVDALLDDLTGLRAVQLHGLLRALALLLTGEQTAPGVDAARRWLQRQRHLPADRVLQALARRIAPSRMVLPAGGCLFDPGALARLCRWLPRADIVHLRQHPRGHGTRLLARPGGAAVLRLLGGQDDSLRPALPDPQELWLQAETAVAGLVAAAGAGTGPRVVTLRLEDLLDDPAAALAGLCRALDLAADPQAVTAMQRPEASPFAGPGPFGAHLPGDIAPLARLAQEAAGAGGSAAAAAPLEGPLPWRPDAAGLRPEVIARARAAGYGAARDAA